MAGNVKISQLPVVATMTDSTIVPVVANGNTQQIDGSAMKIYFTDELSQVAFTAEYSDLSNVPSSLSDFANDTNFITTANANVISVNTQTGVVSLAAVDVPFVETIPGDWGNQAATIDNVGEALDYLANAKSDLDSQVTALSEGAGFVIPGPFVNQAAAVSAGVLNGEIYFDNGGTVRVVLT
jgi:hypothetical protein